MHGLTWFSFKHGAWAVVTNEPVTGRGYYTIEFPVLGIYRRYNAQRIARELADQRSVDVQLDTSIGYKMPAAVPDFIPRREIDVRLPDDAKAALINALSGFGGLKFSPSLNVKPKAEGKLRKLVGVLFLFEE